MTPRNLRRAFGRPLALPLATLGLALALVLNGCSPSTGRVVARVDGHPILEAELVHAAQSMPAYTLDPSPQGKRALLDELVNRSLVVSEAKRRGLDKTPEMARTMTQARAEVLPQVLYDRLVGGRVRVTEDEARALWEHQSEEWRVSQIFTFNESEADAAKKKLDRGTPFAVVAQGMSKDRASGITGGDLGYLTAGQVPREMEEAIAKLKVGRWTGPIQTPIGFYFVQVTDRRPRQREPFETTREALMNMLRQRKERSLVLDYVGRLKQRRHLKSNPEAYALLAQKWQNRTATELLASKGDPASLGFMPAETAMPLEKWEGGAYTIKDFFQGMYEESGSDRPSITDDVALHLYVADRAVNRMILDEAKAMGLEAEPETHLRLKDREDSYLITRIYETVIVPSSQPTPEDLERLRAQMGNLSGDPQAAGKMAQAQQQLFAQKRQQALDEFLARLRREHPPVVDERALAAVPWPVSPKENS